MSELLIEKCSLVVVGAWNPAIITPNWLKQQFTELIHSEGYDAMFVSGPVPAIRFVVEGVVVDPTNGRLTLKPKTKDKTRLDFIPQLALGIYQKLPHTPVGAVGFNFVYALAPNEIFATSEFVRDRDQQDFYSKLELGSPVRKETTHSFTGLDHQLNLKYTSGNNKQALAINFHHQVSQPASIEKAINNFGAKCQDSEKLANLLIKVSA